METMDAESVGRKATVCGPKLTDEKLLREIRRLKRSVG